MNTKAIEATALSIRSLSMDAIQKANSGHPGLPLGAAELAAVLYGEIMKHNPADSKWVDRDRFVLSAGHGSMLLYSILHLAGYKLPVKTKVIKREKALSQAELLKMEEVHESSLEAIKKEDEIKVETVSDTGNETPTEVENKEAK